MSPEAANQDARKLPEDVVLHLRKLAHDLSNSLETILQAAYLLGQSGLEGSSQEWVKMIDSASQDAAQINRQIREILKSQS